LQGQRIAACARSLIEGRAGNWMGGELLFTKYGLSGTCILDISRDISVAINRQHATNVGLNVDMLPFLNSSELEGEMVKRRQAGQKPEEMLVGLLPNKIGLALKGLFTGDDLESALKAIKDRPFKVAGTRGWNEAEFTAGGVDLAEVDALTMQSKIHKDLYFAGEMLDVDGARGGYNLAWAWASGLLAGQTL
jgi:predicted Rossmann fold flavoprotein